MADMQLVGKFSEFTGGAGTDGKGATTQSSSRQPGWHRWDRVSAALYEMVQTQSLIKLCTLSITCRVGRAGDSNAIGLAHSGVYRIDGSKGVDSRLSNVLRPRITHALLKY